MAYVSVEDTGEGIPEDKISLVFEPFRQVDGSSTRRAEGTGLGLPISRQFVELHDGRIWLESEYGVGSRFTFCIPIEGPVESVPELADLEIDEKKKLLLVIEQAESDLEAYRQLADDGEYQLVGLYDGRKAVVWARHLRPWAILVDVERETRVGWDVLEALKSMRATRDYPVVICSEPEDVGRAISMGASACVSKPVVIGDLFAALSRLQR
jgi:CheY-like chemotaxis protein